MRDARDDNEMPTEKPVPSPQPATFRTFIALGAALLAASSIAAAQPVAPALPTVDVVGTTPVPGADLPRNRIPAPVQTATDRDIDRSGAVNLPDYMNRSLGSVHVNEIQGNPYQADVSYRGFTASPLLGTPQGLSVWMDGVRMNQPFGDVVSWDLIPRSAISTMTLMPGSNPMFGLNSLGGSIVIGTKDGRSHPGSAITTYYGSAARRAIEFTHGGFNDKGLDWFVTGTEFKERGWRVDSPSEVRQLFGKLGWRDDKTTARLTMAYADNSLTGNGLQDYRLLATDYRSVYTKPDITDNQSLLLNLAVTRELDATTLVSGNVYFRRVKTATTNGDINEGSLDQSVYQPGAAERTALTAAGYTGFPTAGASAANTPFPFWRCIGNALLNDEPGEKCNGLINRTQSTQDQLGFNGQVSAQRDLGGMKHQVTLGGGFDTSKTSFKQSSQLGYLNADRSVTGVNSFADGVNGGDVDGVPYDNRVDLSGRTQTISLYASDSMAVAKDVYLTLSGRYNHTHVRNRDGITPGGGAGSLDGDHDFSRFNPAVGLNWNPSRAFNAWVGYSESSRAPTSIELGCADPANPCKLPNAMAGDPPLKQVVARTIEAGARGTTAGGLRWNVGVFRTESTDDILFVADDQAGFGYFKNFGKTLRQGLELGVGGDVGPVSWGTQATFIDATYRSTETVNGTSNSSNTSAAAGTPAVEGGTIGIKSGDKIPLIPRQMLKAYADWRVNERATIGLNMVAISSMLARGNENAAHQPDGVYYLGSGSTPGYAIFNLAASYKPTKPLKIFAQVSNLFDRRYYTAGQLGPTGLTGAGNFIARPFAANANGDFPVQHSTFVAPGAPRMMWVGLTYTF